MGLTNSSTGINAVDLGLEIKKQNPDDKVIALAGNPNVGKSTIFNALTGLHQHTGNWPGKTVTNAQGYCKSKNHSFIMVDIPGTYSLMAHSAEEEVARNFICFADPDAVVVVCDATCLERNLNLVLQTMEISKNVIVCVNLMDEAKRKKIKINLELLSEKLQVPVVATSARDKPSLDGLLGAMDKIADGTSKKTHFKITYSDEIEKALSILTPPLDDFCGEKINCRWLALRLLEGDSTLTEEINVFLGKDFSDNEQIRSALADAQKLLKDKKIDRDRLKDEIVSASVNTAEAICKAAVVHNDKKYNDFDRKLDRIFTSKAAGYPTMLLLLLLVFWLTVSAANYPSELLFGVLSAVREKLVLLFEHFGSPSWLCSMMTDGMFKTLAWVVSVMLPPMAIFFPLFTLLEDLGYLPRIAFNLDKPFKRCCACGKQALTMCMGFGCNAAGIVGCRIIDSPRERLLAILTNNFVPCNGRFPALISLITMFFVGTSGGACGTLLSALLLTAVIVIGIAVTFAVTKLLSKTVLKGVPSSFTLELPPYRVPQVGKVIVRSIFDRTVFVLARAAAVAAPAGIIIWIAANVHVGQQSILGICASFLDPIARIMGLDGIILIAFILGFPANEIVIPIIIMAYTASGSLSDLGSLAEIKALFVQNGWTWATAVSTMLFSLMHWPCSTTLLTIKKETQSIKWTLFAAALPAAVGFAVCTLFTAAVRLVSAI